MRKLITLSIAGILTAAVAVRAQYTPGTGGTYVGPSVPVLPAPAPAGYQIVTQPQPAPVVVGQPTVVRVVQGQTVVVAQLSDAQLSDLTASIALYPDALLAEMFPATTLIEELTYADRWQEQHPGADEAAINALPVDDSVKAIMHYPTVMDMLVGHLDWSQAVGMAFTYQRQDLMESIQRWRATAVANGYLYSTAQQEVLQAGAVIMIQPPPQTRVIYVPVYDPAVVYVRPLFGRPRPLNVITFGGPGFSLTFVHNDVDWRAHEVRVPRRDERFGPGGGDRPGGREGPRDDFRTPPPPAGRSGPGPVVEARTTFVPRDPKPGMSYPSKVVTPQPDKKVVLLPPPPPAPPVKAGDTGRARGSDNPGRGSGNNPGRGPNDNPGRGPGDNPGRGPGGGGPPGRPGGFGN
jgi:hypothetical protein